MAAQAQATWEQRFGHPVVGEGIGQTECTPMTLGQTNKRGSLGKAVDHLELKVVDGEDRQVAPGEVGELVVRSRVPHGTFSGYWNMPEATIAAWRNMWHHTGDLVRADDDGCLHFVDRNKDSIRRRGENISSFELEQAILTHEAIAQAAAVSVLSADGTDEEVKLCVILNDDEHLGLEAFLDFVRGDNYDGRLSGNYDGR